MTPPKSRKKKNASTKTTTRKRGDALDNPFYEFLLTMHERWLPGQIADVLSDIDIDLTEGFSLSQTLVLRLSQQRQRPAQVAIPETGRPAQSESDLGKCARCKTQDAVLLLEEPPGTEKVKAFCAKCAPRPVESEEERVGREAGA